MSNALRVPSTPQTSPATSGKALGWPTRRRRQLQVSICRETLVWVGGPNDRAVYDEFMDMFGARVAVDGNVFCGIDEPGNIVAARYALVQGDGTNGVTIDNCMTRRLEDLYQSGIIKKRSAKYSELAALNSGRSGSCIIDQYRVRRKVCGPGARNLGRGVGGGSPAEPRTLGEGPVPGSAGLPPIIPPAQGSGLRWAGVGLGGSPAEPGTLGGNVVRNRTLGGNVAPKPTP